MMNIPKPQLELMTGILQALQAKGTSQEEAFRKLQERYPAIAEEDLKRLASEVYALPAVTLQNTPETEEEVGVKKTGLIDQIFDAVGQHKRIELTAVLKLVGGDVPEKRRKVENLARKLEQYGLIEISTPVMNFQGGPVFGAVYLILKEGGAAQ